MVRVGREKLSGIIEIDEVFIGGVHKGPTGRGALGKTLVAVEDKGKRGYGRIRMKIIKDAKSETLLLAIKEMVEPGSTIRTDEWSSYKALPTHGYIHKTTSKKISIAW